MKKVISVISVILLISICSQALTGQIMPPPIPPPPPPGLSIDTGIIILVITAILFGVREYLIK